MSQVLARTSGNNRKVYILAVYLRSRYNEIKMTTETCYIERKSDKELNQEDARSLASRVRDTLISFNRDIGNKERVYDILISV